MNYCLVLLSCCHETNSKKKFQDHIIHTHPNKFYLLIFSEFLVSSPAHPMSLKWPLLFWGYWVGRDLNADLFSIAWFCVTVHLTVSVTLLVIENSHSLQFSLTKIKTVPSPQEFPSYQTINHKPRLYKYLHM